MGKQAPRQPERGRGGKGEGKPAANAAGASAQGGGLRGLILGNAAMLAMGPFFGILAGFLLLFGGIFLAVAWQVGAQPLIDHLHYASFTSRASGRIVESWAALDFDPARLPKGKLHWQPYAKIATCETVEYGGDWGAPLQRAFCGNRFDFRDDFRLDDWQTLAPGIPFAFERDASGFAVGQVRLSKVAFDWLGSHPPDDTFMLSKPPPTTALGALEEEFDKPYDVAVASWTSSVPELPLAYDPRQPDRPMPARIVDDRRNGFWFGGLIFAAVFAVPGVLVWRLGMSFLFLGLSGTMLWLLTLLPLLALPWWGDVLPRIVAHANRDWAEIVSDMLDDINRTTRLIASAPADATLADGERIVWHAGQGLYADTFGRIGFRRPQPPPANEQAVLAALRAQAAEQVDKLPSEQRTALFKRLRQQYDGFARQVQTVFTTAALDTLRDSSADAAAHRAAKDFLVLGGAGTYYEDQLDALEKTAAPAPAPGQNRRRQ
jgi:hypothetical protein